MDPTLPKDCMQRNPKFNKLRVIVDNKTQDRELLQIIMNSVFSSSNFINLGSNHERKKLTLDDGLISMIIFSQEIMQKPGVKNGAKREVFNPATGNSQ